MNPSNADKQPIHPRNALFRGEKPFPVLPACEHFAGNEKLIGKAFALQQSMGKVFDITCDCEDGAPAGQEKEHAEMVVRMLNSEANAFGMAGARVHDASHLCWKQDVNIILTGAGERVSYLTLPKPRGADDVREMTDYIGRVCVELGLARKIPLHVLIETHGALRDVWEIATLSGVQVLDLGLLDFISAHHGAIGSEAMRSPGQFTHPLICRARAEISAAALANGCVPSHSITVDMKNAEQTYEDALRARKEFGYLRMYSIYPTQIQPIVDAMKPDFEEVREAAAILCKASALNWAPLQHDDKLHDRASYRFYWELLRRARLTGVEIDGEAERLFFS
ncbi:MAG: CoA ester lyase [Deltaproteobacteria bacterium]|nr:CoA ester lyase [Deltaproteobacteria bacterium]